MKKWVVLGVGGLFLIGLLSGASVAVAAEVNADQKTMAELYLKNCSICHGDNGDANTRAQSGMFPKPRDFTTSQAAIELTRERMIVSVTEGRPGTAMVGHKGRLSAQQIEGLVDYVRANFMQVSTAKVGQIPEKVSLGEKVYTENCSVCHGDQGNTAFWAKNGLNPPPRDFTAPESQSVLTRSRMLDSVTNGRPGTGMVSFSSRLSSDEISAVVGFIRFKFMGVNPDSDSGAAPMALIEPTAEPVKERPAMGGIPGVDAPLSSARPAAADPHAQSAESHDGGDQAKAPAAMPEMSGGHSVDMDMSLPVPNGLKGDLVWGRTFYMANCFVCHGVTGEGDGPRAYFNIPRPRNFTSEAARQVLNRPRIFDSITKGRVGTVMPAWDKVLTPQQIAGLTEFVFQTFIQVSETDKKKAP